jgi:hypothetical protein
MRNISGNWMSNLNPEDYVTSVAVSVTQAPGSNDFLGWAYMTFNNAPVNQMTGWALGSNDGTTVNLSFGWSMPLHSGGKQEWSRTVTGTWASDTELQLTDTSGKYTFTRTLEPSGT